MKKTIFKIEIIAKKSNSTNLIDAIKLADDYFSKNENTQLNSLGRGVNKLESSYNVSFKKNKKGENNKIIFQETSRFEIDSNDKSLQNLINPKLIIKQRFNQI